MSSLLHAVETSMISVHETVLAVVLEDVWVVNLLMMAQVIQIVCSS